MPLLLQTCARETALYQLLGPDAADQAEGVLRGYFGAEHAAALLASYAAAYPELDETALRGVAVMSDERYVVRTERLADAQAAHAPVWRSRYDGPYTGIEDDPDPDFAQPTSARRAGDEAWRRARRPDADGHDLRRERRTGQQRPVRARPADLGRADLAAGHLVVRAGVSP